MPDFGGQFGELVGVELARRLKENLRAQRRSTAGEVTLNRYARGLPRGVSARDPPSPAAALNAGNGECR